MPSGEPPSPALPLPSVLLEETSHNTQTPLTIEEAKEVLRTGLWGDDPALRLVLQDAITAENFEKSKQWVMGWTTASTLYQSPFQSRYWEGTQVERANVPFYTVATAVNGLVPQIINGLFAENPPFMMQERPGTTAEQCRAWTAVLGYQLEDINFREECRLGAINVALYGTGIWKWGWETYTQKRKVFKRSAQALSVPNPLGGDADPVKIPNDDEIDVETIEESVDRPTFENIVNLGHVLVDPGLNRPDIRRAKYVIHRMFLTWNDLDKLRDRPGYDIPSKTKLLELFFPPREEAAGDDGAIDHNISGGLDARATPRTESTTEDPFNQPLEVLERWDDKRVTVVLQKKLVICNEENPYGVIPFLSSNWWDVPESFWGMGLAKTIGSEQRLQQGITNTWLDQAALNLNGVYVRVRGQNVPTQNVRIAPGKIVDVSAKDDFTPLQRTAAVPEAGAHIQMSQARAELISGSNEAATGIGGSTAHSNLGRSAAGANLIASGAGNRTADFVEKFSGQVFIPFVYQMMEMNRALLPIKALHGLLNDELQHEYLANGGDLVDLLNARVKVSITAGAKMQARRAMAQALPILTQYLSNQEITQQLAVQGKKVNVEEVLRMFWESSDWKNYYDVIQPMTPEELQRSQASSPGAAAQANAAVRAQTQSALIDKQYDRREQLADQENISRAGREVLRHALETSMTPEIMTGEPGNTGFGSSL